VERNQKSWALISLLVFVNSGVLADEKFQHVQQQKNNIELSIQTKQGGSWRTVQTSQKAKTYKVGVTARFCIKSDRDAYATIWNRYDKDTPVQLAPHESLGAEYNSYLTNDKKAIQLRKGQNICIGDFTLTDSLKGVHRLWVQWKADKKDLIQQSDVNSFTKSIGEVPLLDQKSMTNEQKFELQRAEKNGMVTLLYRVAN
jgi:hypothetical protein